MSKTTVVLLTRLTAVVALVFFALAATKIPSALVLLPVLLYGWYVAEKQPAPNGRRAWPLLLILMLSVAGVGTGIYMTRHHEVEIYGGAELQAEVLVGCAESEGISCDIVNTSEWSEVIGVPLFTWAVPTYLLFGLLAILALGGSHGTKPLILAGGLGAIVFSGFLYYISVVELGNVCLWCMRLYVLNALLPFLALISGIEPEDMPGGKELGTAAAAFAVFAGVSVVAQQQYRAGLLEGTPEIAQLNNTEPTEAEMAAATDPEGPAPSISYDITTEDGNPGKIAIQPDDAWKGNPDAKVAIIEFADFECGYCKRAGFQLRRLYESYKDEIVFVYKHFPMNPACNPGVNNPRHRYACSAHLASVCAQKQGRFWAYHDLLYKNNHQLRDEHLIAYAEKVGLEMDSFLQCMRTKEGAAKVKASGLEGKAAETHGTPRIWIDGKLYRAGASAEQMARAIEVALGHDASEATQNARRMKESGPKVEPIPSDVPEMQHIQYGKLDFKIDTFESAVTNGKSSSTKGAVPGTRMSWYAANDACKAAGKRMCSEQEWIAACQSAAPIDDDKDGEFADDLIEGNAYPYGDFHTQRLCWEAHAKDRGRPDDQQVNWRPVYTGEMPGCVSADGVYDLAGNMEEWVGESADKAVLLGGAFDTPDDKARCYRRNDTYGAGYANMRTGFRCCANP